MTKTKNFNRTLLMSALTLLMCVSMLVGSTLAWFTDSVNSGVNTIQAGSLDIALEYSTDGTTWNDAEGETLSFMTADGRTDSILWEPGCTYRLPAIRVRNNGNLALKYDIVINGVSGNSKLLKAIDFTANGQSISTVSGTLTAQGEVSEPLVIEGHMKETAGNEYQGLTLYGIGITVYATQHTYEKDSNGNEYDDIAPKATQSQINALAKTLAEAPDGSTIYLDALDYGAITLGSGAYTYPSYAKNLTIVGNDSARFTKFTIGNKTIEGWTFKNVTFAKDGLLLSNTSNAKGLTIDGCKFVEGANLSLLAPSGTRHNDVVVKHTSFTNVSAYVTSDGKAVPAILIQGTENITVEDCTFLDAGHNALQIVRPSGTVSVTGNTIDGTIDRAIRFSLSNDVALTISSNTVNTNGDDQGELMKIGGWDNINTYPTLTGARCDGATEADASVVGTDYIVKNLAD